MEKIYMEESKNKKTKNGLFSFSIVLSFAVALFAVFSVAAAGIAMTQGTGVSYALPVTAENFNLKLGSRVEASNPGGTKFMQLNLYYANSVSLANQVFCIERGVDTIVDGEAYTQTSTVRSGKTDVKNDPGVLYLLGLAQSGSNISGKNNETIDGFVIQSALWYYLSQKYTDDVYKLHLGTGVNEYNDDKAVLDSETITLSIDGVSAGSIQSSVIKNLVSKANSATAPRLTATKASDEISKTEDGKFYQSALITVVGDPSTSFTSYDIALSGIEGAIAVNENGEELTTTNIAPGTKFYVRIPAEKVTESVQKVAIDVTGHFNSASGFYYTPADAAHQRMASVKSGDVKSGVEVEFVGSPDTGMNTVQTIYFIGLIVLLCGVGIVYANAKPLGNKQ